MKSVFPTTLVAFIGEFLIGVAFVYVGTKVEVFTPILMNKMRRRLEAGLFPFKGFPTSLKYRPIRYGWHRTIFIILGILYMLDAILNAVVPVKR